MLYMKPTCIPLNDRAFGVMRSSDERSKLEFDTHIMGVARGIPNSCASYKLD
jgi:hypothetical protein